MSNNQNWNIPFFACPSWKHIFGKDAPLELEIGMGRSHFLFERAKAVSDHNIIGIEWKGEWVRQAHKRCERENWQNVHALWGNAWDLVPSIFEGCSLTQIVLNFPDPWWKKKHHKRKIINDDFVDVLVSKLVFGGRIYLATDVQHLFDEYLDRLESNPLLTNLSGTKTRLTTNPLNARSHREKKCEADGVPIYRALMQKI